MKSNDERKLRKDTFAKNRGGPSRLLALHCAKCHEPICEYQKDGIGSLKRLYLDRMLPPSPGDQKSLKCGGCGSLLGVLIVYKKEQRLAYRLVPGMVSKR